MAESNDQPEINAEIEKAVKELSDEFSISPRAQQLLRLYFEIIFLERPSNEATPRFRPAEVEQFMRKVAVFLFRGEGQEGLPPRLRAMFASYFGPKRRFSDDGRITAADLLHAYAFVHAWLPYPYPFFEDLYMEFSGENTDVLRFILDKN